MLSLPLCMHRRHLSMLGPRKGWTSVSENISAVLPTLTVRLALDGESCRIEFPHGKTPKTSVQRSWNLLNAPFFVGPWSLITL